MKILLPILSLFLLFNCVNKTERISETLEIKKTDTITYLNKGLHDHIKLMLFSDKKFKFINEPFFEAGYSETTGTYTHLDNIIILNPSLCIECKYVEYNNHFKPDCDTIEFINLEYKISTKYLAFNWKHKNYLLSEESEQIEEISKNENVFINL